MLIEKIDRKSGFITLEMSDIELRTVANLLCRARKGKNFSNEEYAVNAGIFTAITILHHGRIPAFEFKHIKEMYDKAYNVTQQEDRPKERTLTIVRVRFNTKTDKTYDYEYIGNEPIALGDFVTVETAQGKKDVEILDIFHIKENEAEYDYKTATKED